MPTDPALAELYEAKAQTYAAFGNGAIAEHARRLLPPGGRVLDVGCASGGLLAVLRDQAGHLAGLELSTTAARAAAEIGDQVVQGALEDPGLPFEPDSFDLVVIADVLEHLADPAAGLARAVGLVPAGRRRPRQRAERRALAGAADDRARSLAAARARDVRRQPPALVHADSLARAARGGGLRDVELHAIVPALRNHLPASARRAALRSPSRPGRRSAGARRACSATR